jgi:hypothetical protein
MGFDNYDKFMKQANELKQLKSDLRKKITKWEKESNETVFDSRDQYYLDAKRDCAYELECLLRSE